MESETVALPPAAIDPSDRSLWRTPLELFETLHREFHFAVDLAADQTSRLLPAYHGPDHPDPEFRDSLMVTWAAWAGPGFLNPPWSPLAGLPLAPWPAKCASELLLGYTTVALLPVATSTQWWRYHVMGAADEVRELPHRLRYRRPDGTRGGTARFDSVVVVWRPSIATRKCGPRIFTWDYL